MTAPALDREPLIELLARLLCRGSCPLIQCEFDPRFCPYWRQRRFLVEPYVAALRNWSA